MGASQKTFYARPMSEVSAGTMPQSTVPEDPTNVAYTSDDFVKPSIVDWSVGDPLATLGGHCNTPIKSQP
jgi:hypothetical protein